MKLRTKDKVRILLENFCEVKITVTTSQSKYQGETYYLTDANWRARVFVGPDGSANYAYYYWSSIRLADASEEKFKNLNSIVYDFLGKEIYPNNLIFLDGGLYRVEFSTDNYLYLTEYDRASHRQNHPFEHDILEGFNTGPFDGEHCYWRVLKSNTYRFFLIDNPLDILRIADAN